MKQVLYLELLGAFLKKGKKKQIIKIISKIFQKLSNELNKPAIFILCSLYEKLKISVEVRKIIKKGSTHLVPFPITKKRQFYLISLWLRITINKNKNKISLEKKIFNELFSILKLAPSDILFQKKTQLKLAIINRSNSNYRW